MVFKIKRVLKSRIVTFIMVTMLLVFCFLVHVFVVTPTRSHSLVWRKEVTNDRPIIGIVAIDTRSKHGKTYISSTYVKYLEQAGARVVPIRGGQPEEYYLQMVNFTNGILFPGGMVNIKTSMAGRSISYIFREAMKINDAGDHYPLWGTCLGFQIMCYVVQGTNLLKATDASNASWPLDLMPGYEQSRLFRSAPENIIKYLKTEPVTQNQHNYGIWKEVFQDSKLSQFFDVLSTNEDRKGQTFISTVEAKNYPFYGVQWHPEKNNFNWNPHYVINHDAHAVEVSQYMADFFVNEARKSNHHFPSVKVEAESLIQNYKLVYQDDGTFTALYYPPV